MGRRADGKAISSYERSWAHEEEKRKAGRKKMSAYTNFVKACLNEKLPEKQQDKVGIKPGDKQPVKMKKGAVAWNHGQSASFSEKHPGNDGLSKAQRKWRDEGAG